MQGFDRSAKFYNEMYVKAEEYEATEYGEFSFGRGTRIIYRGELFLNRNLVFFFFLFFFTIMSTLYTSSFFEQEIGDSRHVYFFLIGGEKLELVSQNRRSRLSVILPYVR